MARDLKTVSGGNEMLKYADDCYLIVPESKESTISKELENIEAWASSNNLALNKSKSQELIVSRNKLQITPTTAPGIERVSKLTVLGVILQEDLKMNSHISSLVSRANSDLFALKTMRSHGLSKRALTDVCRATLISKLTYASQAWYGFCSSEETLRLHSVENKARRWGLYEGNSTLADIYDKADKELFKKVSIQPHHVLHPMLPPVKATGYNLRPRGHSFTLPSKTNFSSRNFFIRMLYSII